MNSYCPNCKTTKLRVRNIFQSKYEGERYWQSDRLNIQVTCYSCGLVKLIKWPDYFIKEIAVNEEVFLK